MDGEYHTGLVSGVSHRSDDPASLRLARKDASLDARGPNQVSTLVSEVRAELLRLDGRLNSLDSLSYARDSAAKEASQDVNGPLTLLERDLTALREAALARFQSVELRADILEAENDALGEHVQMLREKRVSRRTGSDVRTRREALRTPSLERSDPSSVPATPQSTANVEPLPPRTVSLRETFRAERLDRRLKRLLKLRYVDEKEYMMIIDDMERPFREEQANADYFAARGK